MARFRLSAHFTRRLNHRLVRQAGSRLPSVAFRFIAANDHPDHDTIATFRRRFLKDIEALFVRVLELAREMGLLKLGTVGLDGTKIHANASRDSALSYEHVGKIEAQLKAEVAEQTGNASGHFSRSELLARFLGAAISTREKGPSEALLSSNGPYRRQAIEQSHRGYLGLAITGGGDRP